MGFFFCAYDQLFQKGFSLNECFVQYKEALLAYGMLLCRKKYQVWHVCFQYSIGG